MLGPTVGFRICDLSLDVWGHTFLYLPVKSLLRFRSVCKLWRDMINDPHFVHLHMAQFPNNVEKNNLLVMMHKTDPAFDGKSQWSVRSLDTFTTTRSMVFEGKNFHRASVMAYVDGLLLLYWRSTEGGIFLWNPCIKKFLQLPSSITLEMEIIQSRLKFEESMTVGLGFDSAINDYKVVAMSWKRGGVPIPPVVEVYEIKVGKWRCVNVNDGPFFECWGPQTLLRGVIHWLGTSTPGGPMEKMITFDVRNEVFRSIELPDGWDEGSYDVPLVSVTVVGESLAFLGLLMEKSRLWVMEEYGDVSTWTPRYTINNGTETFRGILNMELELHEVIYCRWWEGVRSYDNQTGVLNTSLEPFHDVRYSYVYIESLVLLGIEGTKEEDADLDISLAHLMRPRESCASLHNKLDSLLQRRAISMTADNRDFSEGSGCRRSERLLGRKRKRYAS
ncbi:hypothetical protein Droror1_Dr00005074 [Drosera rotundifolia]